MHIGQPMWLALGGKTASHVSKLLHVWAELAYVGRLPKSGKASHMLEDVPCVGMLTICRKASHISAVLKPMFIFKPKYSLFVVIEQSKHAKV